MYTRNKRQLFSSTELISIIREKICLILHKNPSVARQSATCACAAFGGMAGRLNWLMTLEAVTMQVAPRDHAGVRQLQPQRQITRLSVCTYIDTSKPSYRPQRRSNQFSAAG